MLAALLPYKPRYHLIAGWAYMMRWWLKVTCNLTHRVSGMENLPSEPHVMLAKHQSAWETIMFQTIFPPQAWVLKKELLKIPLFGWGLMASRPIAIDRSQNRKALDILVKQGTEKLAEGRSILIFPEGHRMAPGESGKYNPGGAMLAVKAGVKVVPVAHNAGLFWKRRGFLKYPGVIDLRIGPAIDTTDKKPRQVNEEAKAWIEAAFDE